MIRTIIVILITSYGGMSTFKGPFEALLLYLWIAYFRPEAWIYSSWYYDLNISLLVGIALLARSAFGKEKFTFDTGGVAMLLVALHQGLSTYFSDTWFFGVGPYENFVKSLVIAFIILNLITNTSRLRLVLAVMTISLGAEAAKQGWARLITSPGSKNDNGIPFLGDNNAVAVGMFMLVPLALALMETTKRKWERYLWMGVAVGVTYRGLSTYSRGGFLTAGALAAIYIVRSKRHRIRKMVLVGAVGAALLSTMTADYWQRMDTISTNEEQLDASSSSRLHFWRVAIDMANSNPLFGVGHYSYAYHYDQFDFLKGAYGTARAVHSSWFGLIAEGGYLGFALVLVAFGGGFLGCRALAARAGPTDERHVYARAVQNSLIAFSVGGAFVPMQYNEMLWHLIGIGYAARRLALQMATESAEAPQQAAVVGVPLDVPVPAVVGGIRIPVPANAHVAATTVNLPVLRPRFGDPRVRSSDAPPALGGIRAPAHVGGNGPARVGGINVPSPSPSPSPSPASAPSAGESQAPRPHRFVPRVPAPAEAKPLPSGKKILRG